MAEQQRQWGATVTGERSGAPLDRSTLATIIEGYLSETGNGPALSEGAWNLILTALRSEIATPNDALDQALAILADMRLCAEDEEHDNTMARKIGEGTTWNTVVDRASERIRALKSASPQGDTLRASSEPSQQGDTTQPVATGRETPAESAPRCVAVAPEELEWLHRFLNCTVFGPPPSEIQRAHDIVQRLAERP